MNNDNEKLKTIIDKILFNNDKLTDLLSSVKPLSLEDIEFLMGLKSIEMGENNIVDNTPEEIEEAIGEVANVENDTTIKKEVEIENTVEPVEDNNTITTPINPEISAIGNTFFEPIETDNINVKSDIESNSLEGLTTPKPLMDEAALIQETPTGNIAIPVQTPVAPVTPERESLINSDTKEITKPNENVSLDNNIPVETLVNTELPVLNNNDAVVNEEAAQSIDSNLNDSIPLIDNSANAIISTNPVETSIPTENAPMSLTEATPEPVQVTTNIDLPTTPIETTENTVVSQSVPMAIENSITPVVAETVVQEPLVENTQPQAVEQQSVPIMTGEQQIGSVPLTETPTTPTDGTYQVEQGPTLSM